LSAICGLLNIKGELNTGHAEAVMHKLGKYKYDRVHSITTPHYFAGCYLNCITPESEQEVLPLEDPQTPYIINADAIIDNRGELMEKLQLSAAADITDSALILESFKKWGTGCVDHLIGSFVFAIWDKAKQEMFLANDHVGDKLLYYYHSDDLFVYSTLLEPFFLVPSIDRKLNDVYIADFLAINSLKHQLDPELTIYEGILQLPSATAMLVNRDGIHRWQYWRVQKTKELKLPSDQDYEEAFRSLYREVVQSKIRCRKKVGISLSGGLDSTSVACMASELLKSENKTLYSYTQVPMKGYVNHLPARCMADETEYVEETVQFCGNIKPYFVASEGKNMYTEIDCLLEIYEQPYKILENATWLKEIAELAAFDEVGVLLSGQAGNATVSWGKFNGYMQYLLKNLKFRIFVKELRAYAALHHKSSIREALNSFFSLSFFITRLLQKTSVKSDKDFILSPINPEFYRSMQMDRRFRQYGFDNAFLRKRDSFGGRYALLAPAGFSHRAVLLNKLNLSAGIEKRDPTGDKRIIEFCMNLLENQWVRAGEERRFIRYAMKGLMPDRVRANTSVKGKQAADIYQRILHCWEQIREEMRTIGEHPLERKYLNVDLIQKLLQDYDRIDCDERENHGLRMLFRALIFTRFLRKLTSTNVKEVIT